MTATKPTDLDATSEPPDSTRSSEGAGILVVDDNASNLLAIETALEPLGEGVVQALSGSEALRHLLSRDFALVLLDVQMPSMDGFETARLIRQRARNKHTPIIFVTAHDDRRSDMLQAYAMGAVDFLFKPIVPEILCAKASVLIGLQRRAAEVAERAARLRKQEKSLHERELAEQSRKWEQEALRRQMDEKSKVAEEMARRAEELKRTEEKLTIINQQLEDSDRRKDEFLAVLAHELRNPLAPIVTSLDLFELLASRSDPASTSKREAARSAMRRQVLHLTRLVDDLLDVSRISSGKIELCLESLELNPLVEQAVSSSAGLMEQSGHELSLHLSDAPIILNGDVVRLTQVISNLLNNAARYTPPGGKIAVSTELDGEAALIRVRDNGQGIPEDMVDSIFDTFVQVQPKGKGLGLGLTLVKRLVELHGGRVTAHSFGANQGSEFAIHLPRSAPASRPRDKADDTVEPTSPGCLHIVVIEDHDDIRDLVTLLLTDLGHQVHATNSGNEGIRLCASLRPNAALVDIGLADLDGYTVARSVHAELGADAPYMIAMTGFGQEKDRERAFAAGFQAHLIKPATANAIARVLARVPLSSNQARPSKPPPHFSHTG